MEVAEERDDLRLSTVDDLVRTLSDRSRIHRPAVRAADYLGYRHRLNTEPNYSLLPHILRIL
ncbi:hypothetical protein DU504_15905 [Haloplanus salinus]|uniref:Uncharacterized protein n=1 Tax=Haloplanus salinus TaxID=1126245 RepID=A0A368N1Z4_9EURY|nr:hypothetical protein DU504_15905 [Haloplanus salinus]